MNNKNINRTKDLKILYNTVTVLFKYNNFKSVAWIK